MPVFDKGQICEGIMIPLKAPGVYFWNILTFCHCSNDKTEDYINLIYLWMRLAFDKSSGFAEVETMSSFLASLPLRLNTKTKLTMYFFLSAFSIRRHNLLLFIIMTIPDLKYCTEIDWIVLPLPDKKNLEYQKCTSKGI